MMSNIYSAIEAQDKLGTGYNSDASTGSFNSLFDDVQTQVGRMHDLGLSIASCPSKGQDSMPPSDAEGSCASVDSLFDEEPQQSDGMDVDMIHRSNGSNASDGHSHVRSYLHQDSPTAPREGIEVVVGLNQSENGGSYTGAQTVQCFATYFIIYNLNTLSRAVIITCVNGPQLPSMCKTNPRKTNSTVTASITTVVTARRVATAMQMPIPIHFIALRIGLAGLANNLEVPGTVSRHPNDILIVLNLPKHHCPHLTRVLCSPVTTGAPASLTVTEVLAVFFKF